MGELFDTCQQEFERLKPLFEKAGDVDLTIVEMLSPLETAVRSLSLPGIWKGMAIGALLPGPAGYSPLLNAITTGRDTPKTHPEERGFALAHELGHAVHYNYAPNPFLRICKAADHVPGFMEGESWKDYWQRYRSSRIQDPISWWKKQRELRAVEDILVEGFAMYFVDMCVPELDSSILKISRSYSKLFREASEVIPREHFSTGLVSKTAPTYARGYLFFEEVVSLAASKDVVFDIIEHPPRGFDEISAPEEYWARLSTVRSAQ